MSLPTVRSSTAPNSSPPPPPPTRNLLISLSPLPPPTQSILVELSHTKVLATLHGPHRNATRNDGDLIYTETGALNITVKYAPLSSRTPPLAGANNAPLLHSNPRMTPPEQSLALSVSAAITPSVILPKLKKMCVDVHVTILVDDGSARSACIIATSMLLANAGIELYDLVAAAEIAVSGKGELVVDPTFGEGEGAACVMAGAVMGGSGSVVAFESRGDVGLEEFEKGKELLERACGKRENLMRACLRGEGGGRKGSFDDNEGGME